MATTKVTRNRRTAKRPSRRRSPGATHVVIIGAGRGGTGLMEIFANDPLVRIVGMADISDQAPGLGLAKRLHISVALRWQ